MGDKGEKEDELSFFMTGAIIMGSLQKTAEFAQNRSFVILAHMGIYFWWWEVFSKFACKITFKEIS